MITVLGKFCDSLEVGGIPYCVLHSYEDFPERVATDVDFCVNAPGVRDVDAVMSQLALDLGARIVQRIFNDIPKGYYYVVLSDNLRLHKLDVQNDNIGINRYYLSNSELLSRGRAYKGFHVAGAAAEYLYLVIKRVIKGKFREIDKDRLKKLYADSSQEIDERVLHHLGEKGIRSLTEILQPAYYENREALLKELRKTLFRRHIVARPWKWLPILYYQACRVALRALFPTGIHVCILAPDGGGKSSVSKLAMQRMTDAFRQAKYLHWRPGVLPMLRTLLGSLISDDGFSAANPHSSKTRSRAISFFRWLYYASDYVIGYFLKILPMKIRSTAVITDRYYYDIVVDPVRYGFNLPQWILKLPMNLIPKPDLTIYLDNTPEDLYQRKQELPVAEISRQVRAWREFIPSLPNARIVTTSKSLEGVVQEVTRLALERRAEMTRRTLQSDPDASYYLWRSDVGGDYIALPTKANCRWVLPINTTFARRAWDLYLPYSKLGRSYKTLMKSMSEKGLLRLFRAGRLDLRIMDRSAALKRCVQNVFGRADSIPAISTGTPGPYRKIAMLLQSADGNILGYAKIGESQFARERVKSEARVLKFFADNRSFAAHSSNDKGFTLHLPKCLYEGQVGSAYVLIQSPVPFEAKSGSRQFNRDYADILRVITEPFLKREKFITSDFRKKLKVGIEIYPLSYKSLLEDAFDCLTDRIGDNESNFALSHGDFVPWNMLWGRNRRQCFLFDWESAELKAPMGIDIVHFLFQTGFLQGKKKGRALLSHVLDTASYRLLAQHTGADMLSICDLALLYSLHMAVTEDKPQQLSGSAVERRNMIKLLIDER